MLDELKQDFESAMVKHLLFKSKLRSFLYGSKTVEAPIRDPEVCALGQWIREKALPDYGHLAETHELDRLHRHIHVKANELMDLYGRGKQDAALHGFTEVQQLGDQLTNLLQTMEHKLRTQA